jgi:phosphoribosylpyrophosphate synthetase
MSEYPPAIDELLEAVYAVAEAAALLPAYAYAGQDACRETYRRAMAAERIADAITCQVADRALTRMQEVE